MKMGNPLAAPDVVAAVLVDQPLPRTVDPVRVDFQVLAQSVADQNYRSRPRIPLGIYPT